MKKFAAAAFILLALTLVGCGGGNNSGNINGNWTASLTDGSGTQMFAFQTSFVESSAGSLSVNNFSFSTNSPCFVSGDTESGTFVLGGDFNGNVSGQFGMTVQSGTPSGNTLILAGKANGNTITGTWTLTGGSGCTGTGNFTLTKS